MGGLDFKGWIFGFGSGQQAGGIGDGTATEAPAFAFQQPFGGADQFLAVEDFHLGLFELSAEVGGVPGRFIFNAHQPGAVGLQLVAHCFGKLLAIADTAGFGIADSAGCQQDVFGLKAEGWAVNPESLLQGRNGGCWGVEADGNLQHTQAGAEAADNIGSLF